MLKLRYKTEDWRESLNCVVDNVCNELGVDSSLVADEPLGDIADQLCNDTLDLLARRGVDFEQAYQQSRGNWVIVQGGEPSEVEAFEECFDSATPSAEDRIRKLVADTVAEQAAGNA